MTKVASIKLIITVNMHKYTYVYLILMINLADVIFVDVSLR